MDGNRLYFAIAIFNLAVIQKDPHIVIAAYKMLKSKVPAYQLALEDFVILYESSICVTDKTLASRLIDNYVNIINERLPVEEEQRLRMLHDWRFSRQFSVKNMFTSKLNSKYFPWLDNYIRAIVCEQKEKYDEAKMYYLDALSTMPEEWPEREIICQRYESHNN